MSELREVVVVDALRTPIGRWGGALATVRADDLAAFTIRELVARTKVDPERIDDVFWGAANQAGEDNRNVARMAALLAGLPITVPGTTVTRLCASGLQALNSAAQAIASGCGDIMIAGGVESMTRAPYVMPKADKPYDRAPKMFDTTLGWRMVNPNMPAEYTISMGETAENVAEKYGITREEQDEFAVNSHRKAIAAQKEGRFKSQIVPVELPAKKKGQPPVIFDIDEGPREDTTIEVLRALKPAFKKDGTVTAGNAPGVNDGAAALVVTSAARAKELGAAAMVRIVAQATSGVEPKWVMMAPVGAVHKIWEKTGWKKDDVDLYELNEAFSVQALGVCSELGLDMNRVNVNGGAVALGHPIGASGARVLVTLIYEMIRRDVHRGIAALCLGGGNAVAMAVER